MKFKMNLTLIGLMLLALACNKEVDSKWQAVDINNMDLSVRPQELQAASK